jgi:hypothetical protein
MRRSAPRVVKRDGIQNSIKVRPGLAYHRFIVQSTGAHRWLLD